MNIPTLVNNSCSSVIIAKYFHPNACMRATIAGAIVFCGGTSLTSVL